MGARPAALHSPGRLPSRRSRPRSNNSVVAGIPASSALIDLAAMLAAIVLGVAALMLFGAMIGTNDVARAGLFARLLCVVLGVLLTGTAACRVFFAAARSRHPRWHHAYAILMVLMAGWMFVIAFKGL